MRCGGSSARAPSSAVTIRARRARARRRREHVVERSAALRSATRSDAARSTSRSGEADAARRGTPPPPPRWRRSAPRAQCRPRRSASQRQARGTGSARSRRVLERRSVGRAARDRARATPDSMRSGPGQAVGDRHAHVGRAELRQHRAVGVLDHRMDRRSADGSPPRSARAAGRTASAPRSLRAPCSSSSPSRPRSCGPSPSSDARRPRRA